MSARNLVIAVALGLAANSAAAANAIELSPYTIFAGEPATVTAVVDCGTVQAISAEAGKFVISATKAAICTDRPNRTPVTLGELPQGMYDVELKIDDATVASTTVKVDPAKSLPVTLDGWWVSTSKPGTGLLLQGAPNGRMYGALATYDVNGAPTFFTLESWERSPGYLAFSGAIYMPTGVPLTGTSDVPSSVKQIGIGDLVLMPPAQCGPTNALCSSQSGDPSKLRIRIFINGQQLDPLFFERLVLPPPAG